MAKLNNSQAPLAARMRPQTLDEFIGQEHILGPGRLLRRAIQADQLTSLLFYGPPGTGKTTLAQIIANTTQAHFITVNAVLAGVKDLRGAVEIAQERHRQQQRTILFVDEVHRFNKSQQDALLPWVENGLITLIGATTENPYFEVNKALVSRSRIFQLQSLTEADLYRVARQALEDRDRGYGQRSIVVEPTALAHLVNIANGDARALLNALELAVETTPPDPEGGIFLSLSVAEESIQRRAVLYDKEGDAHFDAISAFIKSLRGSDPDAALYWLARMVYAGEDPRFLFRRMIILASEDVGLADPQAVGIVNACAQAFERVGMPEGRYPLAEAALYLATAPKSNSVMGFFDALAAVEQEREAAVPNHLKDANRDQRGLGHGAGYLYPHAYRDHWVAQQYLPAHLQGQVFYQPSDQGEEAALHLQIERRREAQLAALAAGLSDPIAEGLTAGPTEAASDRWLQRAVSQAGPQLAWVRDRTLALAALQRHHVVLDLNLGAGLLTWEALRQVPEGSVYAWARTPIEAEQMTAQFSVLPELQRPVLLQANRLSEVPTLLNKVAAEIRFDRMVGRNVLISELDKAKAIRQLTGWLQTQGKIVLAETIPQQTQRLYRLLDDSMLTADLYQRWLPAEEAIYGNPADPRVNWQAEDLQRAFEALGFRVELQVEPLQTTLLITPSLLDRWFTTGTTQPSYVDHLAQRLTETEIAHIQAAFRHHLGGQTVLWHSSIAFVQAWSPPENSSSSPSPFSPAL
jgi:putative ATPase